jgi:hypothetical protein
LKSNFFDKKPGTSIFSTQNDDPPKSNFFKAPDENYLSTMFEKANISPKKDDEKTLSSSFDKAKVNSTSKQTKKPAKFDFSVLRTNNSNLFGTTKVGSSKLF